MSVSSNKYIIKEIKHVRVRRTYFVSFIILFSILTEKDDIQNAYGQEKKLCVKLRRK